MTEKSNLHPRNLHRFGYDFKQLIAACPDLAPFVVVNKFDNQSIDFANPDAVKMLNKAILAQYYDISLWDIPQNYLCPPIPGRADYIHYIADLLASCHNGEIPKGKNINVLDIGVGANCVYPIIGHGQYGWHFVGTDSDPLAIKSAKNIVSGNKNLQGAVACRLQSNPLQILEGIIQEKDKFDVSICNPPFHSTLEKANQANQRKLKNLGKNNASKPLLNFGGQYSELIYKGGEEAFVQKMIIESAIFSQQCCWFTSLISKKETLPSIYYMLEKCKAVEVRTIDMAQGQKISRIVAWTFQTPAQQQAWRVEETKA